MGQIASLNLNLWRTAAGAVKWRCALLETKPDGHYLKSDLPEKPLTIQALVCINLDTN